MHDAEVVLLYQALLKGLVDLARKHNSSTSRILDTLRGMFMHKLFVDFGPSLSTGRASLMGLCARVYSYGEHVRRWCVRACVVFILICCSRIPLSRSFLCGGPERADAALSRRRAPPRGHSHRHHRGGHRRREGVA